MIGTGERLICKLVGRHALENRGDSHVFTFRGIRVRSPVMAELGDRRNEFRYLAIVSSKLGHAEIFGRHRRQENKVRLFL